MPHPFPGKQRTILVVDDERPIVTLLSEYLASKGFRVATARDGQAAFKAAGADVHLLKPFDPEHLLGKILELLPA